MIKIRAINKYDPREIINGILNGKKFIESILPETKLLTWKIDD